MYFFFAPALIAFVVILAIYAHDSLLSKSGERKAATITNDQPSGMPEPLIGEA